MVDLNQRLFICIDQF